MLHKHVFVSKSKNCTSIIKANYQRSPRFKSPTPPPPHSTRLILPNRYNTRKSSDKGHSILPSSNLKVCSQSFSTRPNLRRAYLVPVIKSLQLNHRRYFSSAPVIKDYPNGAKCVLVDDSLKHLTPTATERPVACIISYLEPEYGKIPPEAIVGWTTEPPEVDQEGNADIDSSAFISNPMFEEKLHEVIRACIENGIGVGGATDSVRALDLSGVGNGNLEGVSTNIIDLAPCSRCAGADTTHIFGSVRLDAEGRPIPQSYNRNVAHRVVSDTGIFKLNPEMERELEIEMLRVKKKFITASDSLGQHQAESTARQAQL